MIESDAAMRARVLLSLQRALLDAVTADLRAVAVRWTATQIDARFVYDHEDLVHRLEIVEEVETLVLADFDEQVETRFSAEGEPGDRELTIGPNEAWAFLRRHE